MRRIGIALITLLTLTVATPRAAAAADLVATYPVGSQPFAVASDQSDGRLYVANSGTRTGSGGGRVSVIDPATNAVSWLDTTKPSGLLALDSAARRLYSSNYDQMTNSVSLDVLDMTSGGLVMSTQVGGLGLALDTTRSRVFVSGGNYLVAMNTGTFDMDVKSVPFGETWFGVATDPALGRVYVTSSRPALVVLDATSLNTIAVVSLPSTPRFAVAVDEVSHLVYVGGNDVSAVAASTLSVMDSGTFALTTVDVPGFPGGLAHSAASHRLWVTDMYGKVVTALDDQTLAVVAGPIALPWTPSLVAFGRDGRLYVSGYSASVVGAWNVNAPANMPPVIDRISVTPGLPATNDTLTVLVETHDPDGDQVTVSYQWTVNGRVLVDETSSVLDLSKPGNGDRNDGICWTVTARDDHPIAATATGCQGVRDSAPVATVTLDDATPATDAVLHASAAATDADGDLLSYTFTWSVNGFTVRTRSGLGTTDQLDLAQPGRGHGDVVSVAVVASDGLATSDPATATAVVRNSVPTVSVLLNDTRPWKHDVILASTSSSDRDGDLLNYVFTWRVDGVVTFTSDYAEWSTFDLNAFAVPNRATITVDVVATDGSATATASATATVTPPGH